jgi:hypothetical protein
LESLYYMLGDHDGIVIFDVPDADAAAAVALLVTSSGAFRSVSTHLLDGCPYGCGAIRGSADHASPGLRRVREEQRELDHRPYPSVGGSLGILRRDLVR